MFDIKTCRSWLLNIQLRALPASYNTQITSLIPVKLPYRHFIYAHHYFSMSLTPNSNRIMLRKHRAIRLTTPCSFTSEMCRNWSSASRLVQSCCQNKMLAVNISAEPDTECSHLYFYLTFLCGSGGGRPVTTVRDCVTTFVKEKILTILVVFAT